MKFDCGETGEEYVKRVGEWHKWFAWYPVKLADHDCRWFEYVLRRKIPVRYSLYDGAGWRKEYKALDMK